ncbi:MAG: alpha/beta fold hydrolase [Cyanobacteria bacterium SZAS LIN-3]|nr:alpha/beta fold hydrolase [Cyanobacteria bacterium SZAS LIN-3]
MKRRPNRPDLKQFAAAGAAILLGLGSSPVSAQQAQSPAPTQSAGASQFIAQSELGNTLKLPVHLWTPADLSEKDIEKARGIIVVLQALIFDGTAFDLLARHLTEKGYVVFSQDFRGYGQWLTDNNDFGGDKQIHFGQSKDDLTKILSALREKHPGKKIYCIGESIGANMALWEASTEPKLMDGAIAVGLTNKRCHFLPRPYWAVTIAKGLQHPKKPVNIKPYMKPVLTEDKELNLKIIDDKNTLTAISPTDLIKAKLTNQYSLDDVEKIPSTMPILVIAGAKDKVQRTSSLKAILKRMPSQQKELVILPEKGHLLIEHRDLDPEIAQLIDSWLEKRDSSSVALKD